MAHPGQRASTNRKKGKYLKQVTRTQKNVSRRGSRHLKLHPKDKQAARLVPLKVARAAEFKSHRKT